MSSHVENLKPRKWRFTWETLAHIPTLRLFLFNPDHSPSIQCKNIKSSLYFGMSLLSVSWTEDDQNGIPVDFQLRVPIPRVLIDPVSSVNSRALEDHIEVKLTLLLPVDHPLVIAGFESVLDVTEDGFAGGGGVLERLTPLSLDSDLKRLSSESSEDGVHFYCKNCSTKLTRIPLRSFLEMPSVDWREVADNWFGACCCSFGGISEKLVSEYVKSYICAEGTCLLDDASIIICKDDLVGYSFSDYLGNDLKHESKLDVVGKDNSTDTAAYRTNGAGTLSGACVSDGVDVVCGTLGNLSLKEEGLRNASLHKSHLILEYPGKLPQGTGYCAIDNTDVYFNTNEACSTDVEFLEQQLKLTSINFEKQYSGLRNLMKDQSRCCIDETDHHSCHLHERSSHDVSIPSSKEQQFTKDGKLLKIRNQLLNGGVGGGFMVRSSNLSNDIEWVEFLCTKCSSLLGSFPSAKDEYTPVDGGVRFFKCYISTSLPVGGSADIFRSHTLQRVFVNRLLESAADELSFRTIVKDLRDKSPVLQIIVLNPKAWCCTGHCLNVENGVEASCLIALRPVVKVLFSDCSIATKAETREVEEWANRRQAAEVYMMECQIKKLIESLKSAQEMLPPSCDSVQGLLLSSLER